MDFVDFIGFADTDLKSAQNPSKSVDFVVFEDFQGKFDVSPLDPLSGLRTNQQFSSFKLKNHTKSAKSMDFS